MGRRKAVNHANAPRARIIGRSDQLPLERSAEVGPGGSDSGLSDAENRISKLFRRNF